MLDDSGMTNLKGARRKWSWINQGTVLVLL